jgi:hypothetical protein
MCEERHLKIDMESYENCKKIAQLKSQALKSNLEDTLSLDVHAINELQKSISPTEDSYKYDYDENYEFKALKAKIVAIFQGKKFLEEASGEFLMILDKTNFYADAGGQVHDSGFITNLGDADCEFLVDVVQVSDSGQFLVFYNKHLKIPVPWRLHLPLRQKFVHIQSWNRGGMQHRLPPKKANHEQSHGHAHPKLCPQKSFGHRSGSEGESRGT